jgi:hypothetical protein
LWATSRAGYRFPRGGNAAPERCGDGEVKCGVNKKERRVRGGLTSSRVIDSILIRLKLVTMCCLLLEHEYVESSEFLRH